MNDGSALGDVYGAHGNFAAVSTGAVEAGVHFKTDMITAGVNYFDHSVGSNILNAMVGADFGMVAAKVEYNSISMDDDDMLKDGALGLKTVSTGEDDTATFTTLCVNVKPLKTVEIPIRYTMVNGSDSNAVTTYQGTSVTLTPTYNATDNSFVRLEYAMATDDNKVYVDGNGKATDSRNSMILELGFLF